MTPEEIKFWLETLKSVFIYLGQGVAYIGIGLIILNSIKNKFLKDVEEKIDKASGGRLDYIREDIKEIKAYYKKIDAQSEVYQTLFDNMHIFNSIVQNFSEDNSEIFNLIKTQLRYMLEGFLRNYQNGSQPEKSFELIKVADEKIQEALLATPLESKENFSRIICLFVDFIKEILTVQIEQLKLITDRSTKGSIINAQFNNLISINRYLQLKYFSFFELSSEDISQKLKEDFEKVCQNGSEKMIKIIKKEECLNILDEM